MARSSHPKKEIEAALRHAESQGWRVEMGGSHAWGKIYCPYNDDGCRCGEFASPASGARRKTRATTRGRSAGWSIIALSTN